MLGRRDGGEGTLPYEKAEKIGEARWKIGINPLKETNQGVARA